MHHRPLRTIALAPLAAALLAAGCGGKIDPRQESGPCTVPSTVTYEQHVKPLMERYCTGCHATHLMGPKRRGAPMSRNYDSYAGTVSGADRAWARIKDASMPLSPPKLTSCEVKVFRAWLDGGKRER